MIVMLSAHRERRVLRGACSPAHTARPVPSAARARPPGGPRHARAIGSRRAHHSVLPVDKIVRSVDGLTLQSFFLTHPVDDISAGSKGAAGTSLCLVLSDIPSRRTGRAACLHRLSTGLCTERLDEVRGSQKTVTTVL